MAERTVGWLCVRCEAKGWRAPVFDSWQSLLKHSTQKHKGERTTGPHAEIMTRRVSLPPRPRA